MITDKFDLKPQRAFTLIELVIVVAIIGILAGIAYPSYQESISKSRRSDAKGALMEFTNAMERYFTQNNTYCDAGGAGGGNTCGVAGTNDSGTPSIFSAKSPINGTEVFYNLTLAVPASGVTYTLTATPANAQANDKCGTLTLSSTGLRGFNGAGQTAATCW